VSGRRFPGPTLREVCSTLIDEDLAPLGPEHTTVQISSRLTDDEFRRLAVQPSQVEHSEPVSSAAVTRLALPFRRGDCRA
jgi:hypothetical protein